MTPENQKLDELMESWKVPEPPRWLEDRIWGQVREEINPADLSAFPRLIRRWLLRPLRISVVAALAGILCIGAISSVLFLRHPEATRVTSDLGLTTDPSISLDRGTLAYSS